MGETEPMNVSFIANVVEDKSQDEDITFYNPIQAEIEIFGNLGKTKNIVNTSALTRIISANNAIGFSESIIVDSGASDNMFNNKNNFSNLVEHHRKVDIGEVGKSVGIEGKGDVVLTANSNTINLRNAYYIPSLPYCLISQTALWNNGGQVWKNHLPVT